MKIHKKKKKMRALLKYLGELKVLQYFGIFRRNSSAPDDFAEVVKVMNHIGWLDFELV